MNRDSLAKMRLDRRLFIRRGWLTTAERERVIAELPDVAAKATTLGESSEEAGGAAAEGTTEPQPAGA